jgi:hypothetical protein
MLTFHHRQELRDTQVSAYNHVIRKIRRHINNNVIVLIDDGLSHLYPRFRRCRPLTLAKFFNPLLVLHYELLPISLGFSIQRFPRLTILRHMCPPFQCCQP